MNLLEHYVVKVFEERQLNPGETERYRKYTPADLVFVKWECDCYGSHSVVEEVLWKKDWEEIKKRGYDLR